MVAAVEITGLRKSYLSGTGFFRRRRKIEALSGVDLSIQPGEIFGLVGRNGYGKTTLIKCVAGLLAASEGSVRVYGRDVHAEAREVRRLIGWVGAEERSFYLRLTARQNLMFFARLQGLPDEVTGTKIKNLSDVLDCNDLMDRRVHELSTGNRQRVSIMRGLMHDPKLLILDEPTRSLDPFSARDLRALLKDWTLADNSRAILVTSHHLQEIETMSDRIAIMGKGYVGACGTAQELKEKLGAGETMRIELRRSPSEDLHASLSSLDVTIEQGSKETPPVLTFRNTAEGNALEAVMKLVLNADLGVRRATAVEIQLQDVIDQLEHTRP